MERITWTLRPRLHTSRSSSVRRSRAFQPVPLFSCHRVIGSACFPGSVVPLTISPPNKGGSPQLPLCSRERGFLPSPLTQKYLQREASLPLMKSFLEEASASPLLSSEAPKSDSPQMDRRLPYDDLNCYLRSNRKILMVLK